MHSFKSDLEQENILAHYLDNLYQEKGLDFERVYDLERQFEGIDLIITEKKVVYTIDEKAQLHYLNKNLPTFTFELSYLKQGELKEGWLFNTHKSTQFYFLITDIHLKNGKSRLAKANDIEYLKITSVNREKLIMHLRSIGLSQEKLKQYDCRLRESRSFGKKKIKELDDHKEGLIYFTEQLKEKPINLQLRLQYLVDNGVAKKFHYV